MNSRNNIIATYIILLFLSFPYTLYASSYETYKIILNQNSIKDYFTTPNKEYIITEDIDLSGKNISMPKGCTLIFEGGRIKNGTITGNNTRIYATGKIWGDDVIMKGSWLGEANPIWFGAIGDGLYDCTHAMQKCADHFTSIKIDEGTYLITNTIKLNKSKTIKGSSNIYSKNVLKFKPKNEKETSLLELPLEPNYFSFEGIVLSAKVNNAAFKNGTTAIDIKSGACINLHLCWITGFEKGIESNYNSYYNNIDKCRFDNIKYCLVGFSPNNLIIKNTRFQDFSYAFYKLSGDGPMIVSENSFEKFSGGVIMTYYTVKNLTFMNNYVEPRDSKLPSGMIDHNKGKYGGGFIIQGNIKTLNSLGNELQINTAKRMYSLTNPRVFNSSGNRILIDSKKSNLEYYYTNTVTPKTDEDLLISFTLKDCTIFQDIPNSPYNSVYKPISVVNGLPTMLLDAYDPVTYKVCIPQTNSKTLKVNSNGWFINERPPKAIFIGNIIYLQGNILNDKQKQTTDNIIAVVPSFNLPTKSIPQHPFTYLKAMDSDFNPVVLKYHYKTREIEYIKGNKSKGIILDGCQITHFY